MFSMIKRMFCYHDYTKERTIHGDEIIYSGFKRSVWICNKCNKRKLSEYLDKLK